MSTEAVIRPGKSLKSSSLLHLSGSVNIPVSKGKFSACDKFVVDMSGITLARIASIDKKFTKWFLNYGGKTEYPREDTTLYAYSVQDPKNGDRLIDELGGRKVVETKLFEIFSLLERQSNEESGILATRMKINAFFVRDRKEKLRLVYLSWNSCRGWKIQARRPTHSTYEWDCTVMAFSHSLITEDE